MIQRARDRVQSQPDSGSVRALVSEGTREMARPPDGKMRDYSKELDELGLEASAIHAEFRELKSKEFERKAEFFREIPLGLRRDAEPEWAIIKLEFIRQRREIQERLDDVRDRKRRLQEKVATGDRFGAGKIWASNGTMNFDVAMTRILRSVESLTSEVALLREELTQLKRSPRADD